MLKIYDEVRHTYNNNRKGIVYQIVKNKTWNKPYLIVWKPISDSDIENHGHIWEWCNEKELKKI